MSKAKAILQRIVDGDNRGDFFISNELLKEIEVALAEPEQEQEPVAWMYEYAVRSSFDASFTGEWKEEMSRSEPDGTVEKFNPSKLESTVRNLTPLYASPKREPLSDEWIKNNIHFIHQDVSFTELVRGIEKAHGIGGE
jgi:hypothetical protein